MPTIEQPVTDVWIDDKVPEKFTHLYKGNQQISLCGAPRNQDVCSNNHAGHFWVKGMMNCPVDGVPICTECLLLAG